MNSTWKSLLWKEWREQRWRFVALTGLISIPMIFLLGRIAYPAMFRTYFNLVPALIACYVLIAGTLIGMTVSGGENSHNTMRFLQAIPTPAWHKGLTKLIAGWIAALVPIVVMWGVLMATIVWLVDRKTLTHTEDPELFYWILVGLFSGILGLASYLLWIVAGGVNRSDEVRAAAIGFLTCISAWMLFALLMYSADKHSPMWKEILWYLIAALPGGPGIMVGQIAANNSELEWPLVVAVGALSHGAILATYLKRFANVPVTPKRAVGLEFGLSLWKSKNSEPMRFQWLAIAWKQFRETGPLAAMTVAGILVIVPVVHYFNERNGTLADLGFMLTMVSLSAGFFVIIVTGIGLFLEDFAPGVNKFWRSRPASVHLWFVVKYMAGLAVQFVAFGMLVLLGYLLQSSAFAHYEEAIFVTTFTTYALIILYTLALASYCLLRQPIYAAVLTFAIFLGGMMSLDWLFPDPSFSKCAVTAMVLALGIPFTIAWLAVKHDWGWKAGR